MNDTAFLKQVLFDLKNGTELCEEAECSNEGTRLIDDERWVCEEHDG